MLEVFIFLVPALIVPGVYFLLKTQKSPKRLSSDLCSVQEQILNELTKLFTSLEASHVIEEASSFSQLTPTFIKSLGIHVGTYGQTYCLYSEPYACLLPKPSHYHNASPGVGVLSPDLSEKLSPSIRMISYPNSGWEQVILNAGGLVFKEDIPKEWWADCLDHLQHLNFKVEIEGSLYDKDSYHKAALLIEKASSRRWLE